MSEPALLSLYRRVPRAGDPVLEGPLDGAAIESLHRSLLEASPHPGDVLIRCDGVTRICDAAAARLWLLLCQVNREPGRRVLLTGLPERFERQLRAHPLAPFIVTEAEIFGDPFWSAGGSER